MFSAYIGFIGINFFLLSTDSTYSRVHGDKGGSFFFRLGIFFRRSFYVQIGVLQFVSRVQCLHEIVRFLRRVECNKFVCNKFVSNLIQIDLIQFENSNCIRSICTKTNTHLLHTNLLHSISRKIRHVIQIAVHQFVHKKSAEKNSQV